MAKRRTRRKSSTARRRTARRSPVTRLRRNKVYVTNRPKRRRSYRRNPAGMLGQVRQLGMDAVGVLAGQAASRTLSGLIPIGGTPITELAKGAIIAIGIRKFGGRFLGNDFARMAAVGAFTAPLRDAIVSVFPQAGGFLGAYPAAMAMPAMAGWGGSALNAYPGEIEDTGSSSLGTYSGEVWNQ